MKEISGWEVNSVPAFGHTNKQLTIIVSESLAQFRGPILVSVGFEGMYLEVYPQQLFLLLEEQKPIIAEIQIPFQPQEDNAVEGKAKILTGADKRREFWIGPNSFQKTFVVSSLKEISMACVALQGLKSFNTSKLQRNESLVKEIERAEEILSVPQ